MPWRVPGCRDDANAGQHFLFAVELHVRGAFEVDPLRNRVVLCSSRLTLEPLHVDRSSAEEAIPAAVVEMQVGVDHADDVARDGVRIEPRRPLLVECGCRVDQAGIDQHAALRVLDQVQEAGPPFAVHEYVAVADRLNVGKSHESH